MGDEAVLSIEYGVDFERHFTARALPIKREREAVPTPPVAPAVATPTPTPSKAVAAMTTVELQAAFCGAGLEKFSDLERPGWAVKTTHVKKKYTHQHINGCTTHQRLYHILTHINTHQRLYHTSTAAPHINPAETHLYTMRRTLYIGFFFVVVIVNVIGERAISVIPCARRCVRCCLAKHEVGGIDLHPVWSTFLRRCRWPLKPGVFIYYYRIGLGPDDWVFFWKLYGFLPDAGRAVGLGESSVPNSRKASPSVLSLPGPLPPPRTGIQREEV